MTRLHVTGCAGFIGQELSRELRRRGLEFSGSSRFCSQGSGEIFFIVEDIGPQADWQNVLARTDIVIHLAARAHVLKDKFRDPLAEFRRVNCAGTLNLARQAGKLGVRRFVFVSSIGVNGVNTFETPFTEDHIPQPHSDYALAKWEAEQGLRHIADETGMELVIIRSPLVYGSDVKGNFKSLLRVVANNIPLPFKNIRNRRSLISVQNLVDFLILCAVSPKAANELFLVADGDDLSTPDLIHLLAEGMGKTAHLLPMPVSFLRSFSRLMNRESLYQQLCGSLQVDSTKARNLLGWSPVIVMEDALRMTGAEFSSRQQNQKAWL